MIEHVTADECRAYAAAATCSEQREALEAAAATIEALQERIAASPPASVDTDALRALGQFLDGATADHMHRGWGSDWAAMLRQAADALDASRAECERLRDLLRQCEWAGYREDEIHHADACPVCGGMHEDGHHHACPVPVALGDDQ